MKKLSIFICALFAVATVSAQRVAVLDFNAGVGVSQADVDGISAIFSTYFSPRGYTLVERTQIDRVIDGQNFQRGKLTQSQMICIGKILNVEEIVVGSVNIVANQYNVDVRILNVKSGIISVKDGATWAPGSSYRTMMSQLGMRLENQISTSSTTRVWRVGDFYDINGKQGVVYAVTPDGKHGKMVSITRTVCSWSDAKSWCSNLGSGWRLPTQEELKAISEVIKTINKTLAAVGEEMPLEKYTYHWSSTEPNSERSWGVQMYDGYTYDLDKGYTYYVRAVSAF